MDYRPLGSTGLNVSEIGFGCGNVIAAVEESLTRMQRERVDLIQMHNHVASVAEGGSVSPEETLLETVSCWRVERIY